MNPEQYQEYKRVSTAAKNRKEALHDAVATTRKCDGTSIPMVREWLLEIQMARAYFSVTNKEADTRKLVVRTLQGPMRRYYESFLDAKDDREVVTWAEIKLGLSAAYLMPDESEYLRSDLEKIKQSAYETTGAYGRRFSEAANMAYAKDDRNDVVHRVVLERYIKGLRCNALKKRVIQETRPTNIDEALAAVQNFSAQGEQLRCMIADSPSDATDQREEPMEIGAMYAPPQQATRTPSSDALLVQLTESMDTMNRQMQGVQKEMAKLKAQTLYAKPHPNTSTSNADQNLQQQPIKTISKHANPLLRWTVDNQYICIECEGIGHIGKDCIVRRRRLEREQGMTAHPNQHSGN
jgi:hypothetical protein